VSLHASIIFSAVVASFVYVNRAGERITEKDVLMSLLNSWSDGDVRLVSGRYVKSIGGKISVFPYAFGYVSTAGAAAIGGKHFDCDGGPELAMVEEGPLEE
jgi:hypothetical protein